MNKSKSSGTFREPCGTPAFKFIFDLKSLSSVLQVKLHMKLNLCFGKPYTFSFDSRRSWFIVSKAFQRFIYIDAIFFFFI